MLVSPLLANLIIQISYASGFLTGSALAMPVLPLALCLQAGERRGEWKGWVKET